MRSFFLLIFVAACSGTSDKAVVHVASTPADATVRTFLGIPLTDSIDFIRRKLALHPSSYEIDCRFGVSAPNTRGFKEEKRVRISGRLKKQSNFYTLTNDETQLSLFALNPNLLHIMDEQEQLLAGNGGWSYVLNRDDPQPTQELHHLPYQQNAARVMAFQGRTPCVELAQLPGVTKRSDCIKMKWYFVLFSDSTGRPQGLVEGPRAERIKGSNGGTWEIIQSDNTIFKLKTDRIPNPLYLARAFARKRASVGRE